MFFGVPHLATYIFSIFCGPGLGVNRNWSWHGFLHHFHVVFGRGKIRTHNLSIVSLVGWPLHRALTLKLVLLWQGIKYNLMQYINNSVLRKKSFQFISYDLMISSSKSKWSIINSLTKKLEIIESQNIVFLPCFR